MLDNIGQSIANLGASVSSATSAVTNALGGAANLLGGSTPGLFDTTKTSIQKYNDLTHEIELYLDNSGSFLPNPENRFHINPASVLNLCIFDTFNNWITEGNISFLYLPDDAPEDLAGQTSSTLIQGARDNNNVLKSYQIRGDGFDILRVRISPKIKEGEADSGSGLYVSDSDPKWWLSFLFSVYDIEDISDIPEALGPAAFYMKCVKMHFRDVRQHILQTTNLEYSTATSEVFSPDFNTGLANEGCLYVGDAIMDILNLTLGEEEFGGSQEFVQTPGEHWDVGENKIFYTSPANYSAADDIEYLRSHYVPTKQLTNTITKDIGIMCSVKQEKPGLINKISLTPMSTFFEKAGQDSPGELQLEHFFVTSSSQESKAINQEYRAPIGSSSDRDLKTSKYGQILTYSFVDMAPDVNSKMMCTMPVYSVDIGSRKFRVEFQNNKVTDAKKLFADNYISKLHVKGSNYEELFLPTLHKTKEKRNVFPIYTLNGEDIEMAKITRQKSGIAQLLYTGLFQNACICFKVLGLTFRQPGSFIAIDKMEGCQDSDYNNKLYGQWFVVKVDHVFEAGSYVNVIYAIKIHRFKAKEVTFNSTLDQP
jgi:hypothetical protein